MKILKKKKETEIQRCQVVRVLYIFKSSKLAEGCTANKEKPQIKLLWWRGTVRLDCIVPGTERAEPGCPSDQQFYDKGCWDSGLRQQVWLSEKHSGQLAFELFSVIPPLTCFLLYVSTPQRKENKCTWHHPCHPQNSYKRDSQKLMNQREFS